MVESLQSSIKAAMLQLCLLKCIGNINDEKKKFQSYIYFSGSFL